MNQQPVAQQKIKASTAIAMVVANMIGTGVFTALGFQVMPDAIPDAFAIMVLWLVGGIYAYCGARIYAHIALAIGRSGGEYRFLTDLYHPALGFASGWISLFAGFSAAIASLALASAAYAAPLWSQLGVDGSEKIFASVLILLVASVQFLGLKSSGRFQLFSTSLKITLIVVILLLPFIMTGNYAPSGIRFSMSDESIGFIFSKGFAGALVWVMFAYSGWNAASYIVGNLENPRRSLPIALAGGSLLVMAAYLLLNAVFLYSVEMPDLAGQVDLGNLVVQKVAGQKMTFVFSILFSLALVSGISAMFLAGPRVYEQMGLDHRFFRILAKQNRRNIPVWSVILQALISIVLVFVSSFRAMIEYIGLTLAISSLLVACGYYLLPKRDRSNRFSVNILYPTIFIALSLWMILYFTIEKPERLFWSLVTFVVPMILYVVFKRKKV